MLTDLPNLLTLSRIAAIPLLVALAALHTPGGTLRRASCLALAGLTDYFDGKIARGRRQTSDIGRMLDPIADKLLVGATLIALAGHGRLSAWGLYPAIVILLREILVSGLREYLAGLRIGLPVTGLAKWKTGFQMGALGTLLAGRRRGAGGPPRLPAGICHRGGHAVGRGRADLVDGMGLPDGRAAPRRRTGQRHAPAIAPPGTGQPRSGVPA